MSKAIATIVLARMCSIYQDTYDRSDYLTYLGLCPIMPRNVVLEHPEVLLIGRTRPEPAFSSWRSFSEGPNWP